MRVPKHLFVSLKGFQQQSPLLTDASGTLALSNDRKRYYQNAGFVLVAGGQMFVQKKKKKIQLYKDIR